MSLQDGMFAQRFNAVSGKVDWVHVPEGKQVFVMHSCTYMTTDTTSVLMTSPRLLPKPMPWLADMIGPLCREILSDTCTWFIRFSILGYAN